MSLPSLNGMIRDNNNNPNYQASQENNDPEKEPEKLDPAPPVELKKNPKFDNPKNFENIGDPQRFGSGYPSQQGYGHGAYPGSQGPFPPQQIYLPQQSYPP